ncbi:hypothetical protein QUF90_10805 [Desulfococcaceae bacterium HSG9]|nr:hypothetical protein [Desulfococcaceae bacterium HSG9]
MFVADVSPVPLSPIYGRYVGIGICRPYMGLSEHGGFGFYKYAAPTELKTDMPFVTFQKLSDLLNLNDLQLRRPFRIP